MINLEIAITPACGKKIELRQSIVYFQETIENNHYNFEIVTEDEEAYQLLFSLKSEKEAKKLLEGNSFTLLSGAIQTLCEKQSLIITDRVKSINIFSCENFSKIKNYLSIN